MVRGLNQVLCARAHSHYLHSQKSLESSQSDLMSSEEKHFYEFGPYRVDPEQNRLWRGEQPVALQPKAFETLLILVQQGQRLVTKDELMRQVWPDTFVEEANLAQTIFVLRKALGEPGGRYIVTAPGRGYRFAQRVRVVAAEDESLDAKSQRFSDSRGPAESAFPAAKPSDARGKRRTAGLILLAVICLAVSIGVVLRPTVPPPRILRIRQITQMGTLLYNNRLITDGPRIYFRAWEGHDRVIRYVLPGGGDAVSVEPAFAKMDINDISADGSDFLVVELKAPGTPQPLWWIPVTLGSPRPVGTLHAEEARCSPDGRSIAYTVGSDLYLANNDGSNSRKFATLPGSVIYLQWSPDGRRLRFSVRDIQAGTTTLWQGDLATRTVRPMLPDWAGSRQALASGWTPDGRYFLFTSSSAGTRDVWAIQESRGLLHRINPEPVQLTAGPFSFHQPRASKDGRSIYAVGEHLRGELMREDKAARQFVPYAQGQSIDHLAFSRDAQWMAYVQFPEGVLVRSRVDGSDRRQLTFAPMRAFSPQWSPDGSQLAFDAAPNPGAPRKIYILPRDGGVPVLAAPDRSDRQVYPSWSPQGNSLLFAGLEETTQTSALYMVDLQNRHVTILPGTDGLRKGQISPDGRQIAALSGYKLMIYDVASHNLRTITEYATYPLWSADGTYVVFRTPYFFPGHIENPGVYRWFVSTDKIEKIATDPAFRLNGVDGVWSGLTPDGSLLLVRDLSTSDLYALDADLP